jgi:phospholipid-translocating ATPase
MGSIASREPRTVHLSGRTVPRAHPSNKLDNQKYNIVTFLPLLLYHEFKLFFNMFFLLIALSQFVPFLKVGLLVTYVAPLGFVLAVTMLKEAWDDWKRAQRDKELNLTKYERLALKPKSRESTIQIINAKDIKVGQILRIRHNQRVPADMLLLHTSEASGSIFLRTDQLDGETDWKLRKPLSQTQQNSDDLLTQGGWVVAMPPSQEIYDFKGYYQASVEAEEREPLSLENTMWQNTVMASQGYACGLVLYSGYETRTNMSAKKPRSKIGSLDLDINFLAKFLFGLMLVLALLIIAMDGFLGTWYWKYFRCVLLLCSIIPISMRINLDFAKVFYSYQINSDESIQDTVARNSQIPEELGRIQYLLSDKTGTLTCNDMIFKKINLEYYSFTDEDREDIRVLLRKGLRKAKDKLLSREHHQGGGASSEMTSDEGGSLLDPEGFLPRPNDRP